MKLTKNKLEELIYELSKTPFVNEKEWNDRLRVTDAFRKIKENKEYTTALMTHYSFRNKNLNKIISEITKRDISEALSLHTIEAYPPESTREHMDAFSHLTLNILLEDDFEGGYIYINGEKINGLRERGDYLMYNGSKEPHSVTPVIKGKRKSLIVWYGRKRELI
jgi:predicted 2-oxoglutarate/Fe(II)-dependent dioxygenase YbiX